MRQYRKYDWHLSPKRRAENLVASEPETDLEVTSYLPAAIDLT